MDSFQVNLQSSFCWPLFLPLFPIEPTKQKLKIYPSAAQKLPLCMQSSSIQVEQGAQEKGMVVCFLKSPPAACNFGAEVWCLSYQ